MSEKIIQYAELDEVLDEVMQTVNTHADKIEIKPTKHVPQKSQALQLEDIKKEAYNLLINGKDIECEDSYYLGDDAKDIYSTIQYLRIKSTWIQHHRWIELYDRKFIYDIDESSYDGALVYIDKIYNIKEIFENTSKSCITTETTTNRYQYQYYETKDGEVIVDKHLINKHSKKKYVYKKQLKFPKGGYCANKCIKR